LMGQPDAMSLLSPLVKDAANSYVGGLGSLTSMLSGVKGWQDALKLVEKIQPTINQVGEAYSTLASTSGADRANLLKAFGPKINSANSSFLGQSSRIQNDSLMGKALGTALEQVKLFK
ncbi:MAG: hypothetical protein MUE97_05285, partial [Phycisphaerales bacterium]|nr:hypothetical protein [Phycisphaerales bacterium]